MNFNNSLELTQSQKLIITMQLKQSLNILNMSKLELEEEIKREYEETHIAYMKTYIYKLAYIKLVK